MTEQNQSLEDLKHIRQMMERSSRFISLSGFAGIFAGIFAIIGGVAAYWYIYHEYIPQVYSKQLSDIYYETYLLINFLLFDGIIVLILAISSAIFFTTRKANKKGLPIWDHTVKRLLVNLIIPLVAGGLFILALIYHRYYLLIPSATLVFYGLALINAGHFTLHDIRYLGFCQIILGILCGFLPVYGLFFWIFGFGVLHIVYGFLMYMKYERDIKES